MPSSYTTPEGVELEWHGLSPLPEGLLWGDGMIRGLYSVDYGL